MDKITAAMLKEFCEIKGIELDKSLKNDAEKVFEIISDDVLLSGTKAKLESASNKADRIAYSLDQILNDEQMNVSSTRRELASLKKEIYEIQTKYNKIFEAKCATSSWTDDKKLVDSRLLFRGLLSDAKEIIGEERLTGDLLTQLVESWGYITWKTLGGSEESYPAKKGRL